LGLNAGSSRWEEEEEEEPLVGGGGAAAAAGLGGWVGGWRRVWRACKFGATMLPVGGGPPALLMARLGRTPATGREEVAGRTATATVLGGGSFAKKEKEFMGGFGICHIPR